MRPLNSFHRKNAVKKNSFNYTVYNWNLSINTRRTYLSAILNVFAALGSVVAGITDGALTGAGCVWGDPLKS